MASRTYTQLYLHSQNKLYLIQLGSIITLSYAIWIGSSLLNKEIFSIYLQQIVKSRFYHEISYLSRNISGQSLKLRCFDRHGVCRAYLNPSAHNLSASCYDPVV
jgi:hypothetical protein